MEDLSGILAFETNQQVLKKKFLGQDHTFYISFVKTVFFFFFQLTTSVFNHGKLFFGIWKKF